MSYYFDEHRINFDDDQIKVYKGRCIIFQGQYDEYFWSSDELADEYDYDAKKHVYIGKGASKGYKVRKVK